MYTLSSLPKDTGSGVERHGKKGQGPGPWGVVPLGKLPISTDQITPNHDFWADCPTRDMAEYSTPDSGQELQDG